MGEGSEDAGRAPPLGLRAFSCSHLYLTELSSLAALSPSLSPLPPSLPSPPTNPLLSQLCSDVHFPAAEIARSNVAAIGCCPGGEKGRDGYRPERIKSLVYYV